MTNTKVELGCGFKVSGHDVGRGFAEVLLLASVVPRREKLLFGVGLLGYYCPEHLQQRASGKADVYSSRIN